MKFLLKWSVNNFSCFARSDSFLAGWGNRCRHHDWLGLAGVWIVLLHWLSHDRLLLHHSLTTIRVVGIGGAHRDLLGHHWLLLLHGVGIVRGSILWLSVHHLLLRNSVVRRGDNDILGIVCVRVLTSGDHLLTVHLVMLLSLTGLSALNCPDHAYNSDDNTNAASDGQEDVEEDNGSDSLSVIVIIVVVVV